MCSTQRPKWPGGGLPWANEQKSTTEFADSLLESETEAEYSLASKEDMTTIDI